MLFFFLCLFLLPPLETKLLNQYFDADLWVNWTLWCGNWQRAIDADQSSVKQINWTFFFLSVFILGNLQLIHIRSHPKWARSNKNYARFFLCTTPKKPKDKRKKNRYERKNIDSILKVIGKFLKHRSHRITLITQKFEIYSEISWSGKC